MASRVASTSPRSSLASRVCTLPRRSVTLRSGRRRRTCACRRSEAEPTTAPSGRSREALEAMADEGVAHVLARQDSRRSTMPSGSAVGRSLAEWTARSMAPSRSAMSSSLVNSPLPPASESGRSWMASPVVLMIDRGRRSALQPWAAISRSCVSWAWARASGLPRVPMTRVDGAAIPAVFSCHEADRRLILCGAADYRGRSAGP